MDETPDPEDLPPLFGEEIEDDCWTSGGIVAVKQMTKHLMVYPISHKLLNAYQDFEEPDETNEFHKKFFHHRFQVKLARFCARDSFIVQLDEELVIRKTVLIVKDIILKIIYCMPKEPEFDKENENHQLWIVSQMTECPMGACMLFSELIKILIALNGDKSLYPQFPSLYNELDLVSEDVLKDIDIESFCLTMQMYNVENTPQYFHNKKEYVKLLLAVCFDYYFHWKTLHPTGLFAEITKITQYDKLMGFIQSSHFVLMATTISYS